MKFLDHSHEKYDRRLSELSWNEKKAFVVDFSDLYLFDEELSTELLENPKLLADVSNDVLGKLKIRVPEYPGESIRVALRSLPEDVPLRSVGASHIGRYIQVSGITVKAAQSHPYIVTSKWECESCGEYILVTQSGDSLKKPKSCKCENTRRFKLIPLESGFIDSQLITLQERPEELPPGQLPRNLVVVLKDDLVDTVRPGDRVVVNGVVKLKDPSKMSRVFDMFVDAFYIESGDREDLDLTPEDEGEIISLSQDPYVFEAMMRSVAPSIYGHNKIKEAILYLLFGGSEKIRPDVRIRGDINTLLVGDPGMAKSQLLEYAAQAAPRGILTTGRGSSAAGLTASVSKEKDGNMVLEAGALVLADRGICCIDEIDKMRDEDRGAIHPAMEQQRVYIAKGGIVATLNARTAILAAANPALGRYNPYQNVAQNISLPITILSRFDLIFVIKDLPHSDEDDILAKHILDIHQESNNIAAPDVDPLLFKKYISYAKRIKPKLTDRTSLRLRAFYVKMRNANKEGSAVSITARQLESLIRISEARARLHLRKEVLPEDTEAAIKLMTYSLDQVGVNLETGERDIDVFYSGKPKSLQDQLVVVLEIIGDLEQEKGTADEDEIYEIGQKMNLNVSEIKRMIGTLHRDGTIFEPRPRHYKRTSSG